MDRADVLRKNGDVDAATFYDGMAMGYARAVVEVMLHTDPRYCGNREAQRTGT